MLYNVKKWTICRRMSSCIKTLEKNEKINYNIYHLLNSAASLLKRPNQLGFRL